MAISATALCRILATGLVVSALLSGCAQTAPPVPEIPPEDFVGTVPLIQSSEMPAEFYQLDIGVLIFDAEPADPDIIQLSEWLVDEIGQKEINYLPYVLRNTLVQSNQWGTVRVLPEGDPSLDLSVAGTIVRSDGINLVLRVTATDSTGRQWLSKTYADATDNRDYRESYSTNPEYSRENLEPELTADPFQDLFDRVANDLFAAREELTLEQLSNIAKVSRMRYGNDLSPEVFGRTLSTDEDGLMRVNSLLAEDDPMIRRLDDIKLRHYLFIDTVDEYYGAVYEEMQPLYNLWRQYSREQILETREDSGSSSQGGSGFQGLAQSYDRFKWAKIYEQEFTSLSVGFNNEIAPAILELNRQVRGLSGSVEEQYAQWRAILRELFVVETGQDLSIN